MQNKNKQIYTIFIEICYTISTCSMLLCKHQQCVETKQLHNFLEVFKMNKVQFKEIIKATVEGLTDYEKKVVSHFEFNYKTMMENCEDNANFVSIDWVAEAENISKKQLRGVFSSMIKKGLIFDGEGIGVDDDVFYLAYKGIAVYFYIDDRKDFDSVTEEDIKEYFNNID